MDSYLLFLLFLGAYLLGSIPFGKLIAHAHGIDIQTKGSGNIGFANVRRIVGWRAGLLTLFADVVKGLIPTLLALEVTDPQTAFFVGLAAIVGHVFPVWLKFRGGKGIATGLGLVCALHPLAAAVGATTYVLSCLVTKVSSRSSLIGLLATMAVGIALAPSSWWQYVLLLLIALWTLRHNLMGKVPNYDT
jgi:glycerol-3-phosphate acyltransferase PlsY